MKQIREKKELCIVHVGMPKTGSSTIQNYLTNALTDSRFFYPDLGSPNQSEVIYSLFENHPENYHSFIARGALRREVLIFAIRNKRLLTKSITESTSPIMILSGEDILNMSEDALSKFKHFLSLYFKNIHIVGYIRPVHSYIQSAFQELVKHGLDRFNIEQADPRYERFLKLFNVFEEKDILLIPFIRERLYREDVVFDFCQRIGLQVGPSYISRNDNETLSKEVISLLYTYQRFQVEGNALNENYFKEKELLVNAVRHIGQTKFRFSPDITAEIVTKNLNVLKALEQKSNTVLKLNENRDFGNSAVSLEEDLFRCAIECIGKLRKVIGKEYLHLKEPDKTPEYVAALMSLLKDRLLHGSNH